MNLNFEPVEEVVPEFKRLEDYTIEEIYKLYECFKHFTYEPIYIVRNGKITIDYEEYIY